MNGSLLLFLEPGLLWSGWASRAPLILGERIPELCERFHESRTNGPRVAWQTNEAAAERDRVRTKGIINRL